MTSPTINKVSQNDAQQLCIVPKFIQLQYHQQQQMHCYIKLINKLDQVISFKIKTNNPQFYLVKPMDGNIYNKDQIKILFKRKELTPQQFQYFMANPNMQAKQKFMVEIQANHSDAIGRSKKITQTSYISAKFVKNKGSSLSKLASSPGNQQKQQLIQSPKLKSKLSQYKQQYQFAQTMIQKMKGELVRQPLTKHQFILLLIISFLFGLSL